jgi:ADP-ribose pyrophosphatase YjhB (NUDIX family)
MTTSSHFLGPVALKALIQNAEGRVLVCMNVFPGEPWDLPGGTLNAGEHPIHALKREVKEELNVDIIVHEPVAVDHFIKRGSGKQTVLAVFRATLTDPNAAMDFADKEISEIRWISGTDLDSIELFSQYYDILKTFFTR